MTRRPWRRSTSSPSGRIRCSRCFHSVPRHVCEWSLSSTISAPGISCRARTCHENVSSGAATYAASASSGRTSADATPAASGAAATKARNFMPFGLQASCHAGGAGLRELAKIGLGELRAEVAHAVEQVGGAEVVRRAAGMNEPGRLEAVLLEIDERQAPRPARYRLATAAAARAPGRRPLGAVQARETPVPDSLLRGGGELRCVLDVRSALEGFDERLGTLERGTLQVKPQRGLTVAEHVRDALAEPQLVLRDRTVAAAAFRAAGFRRLDHVAHRRRPTSLPSRSSARGRSAARVSTAANGSVFWRASIAGTVSIV